MDATDQNAWCATPRGDGIGEVEFQLLMLG
jgi:hypothetical protein